ncbi:trehalase-like domain-containing protein [Micromonospora coriariae]|uniref:trehalase-like domain-containing protein n=1 Tax=Micromonospora coriariae TaxID=285665 RepID=UPI0018D58878|nr:trehalase-like domain-containing protein [Micromonospora coriariae]
MSFPPVDSYAFLSDTHTAALVAPDGTVEWFCVPHFEGDAVFARLLDRQVGGGSRSPSTAARQRPAGTCRTPWCYTASATGRAAGPSAETS